MVQGQLKSKVMDKLEETRRLLGLDVVVRLLDGDRATEENTPLMQLLHMHQDLEENSQGKVERIEKKQKKKKSYMVLLEMKLFACSVGEPSVAYFSLWHKDTNTKISDEYAVSLTAQGMPVDESKIANVKTLFKDVSEEDLSSLHLVVRVVRCGRFSSDGKADGSKAKSKIEYRRPFGGGVLSLEKATEKEVEHTIPTFHVNNDASFSIIAELIVKNSKEVSPVPKAKGVIVSVSLLRGSYVEILDEHPELQSVTVTERFGFPDVVFPGVSRNDFYVTLESGEFLFDRSTKTVDVSACVKTNNGEVVEHSLYVGTGERAQSEYRSVVLYHVSGPRWGETFRVSLKPEEFASCHLFFSVKQASASSTKEIAQGYLMLTQASGAVMEDGSVTVSLFKPPKIIEHPTYYLQEPQPPRKGDALQLTTKLCSTKLTSNVSMHSLLGWKSNTAEIPQILDRFTFVSKLETIKFLHETFDALFMILERAPSEYKMVYDAIVHVIGILVDERSSSYTNFRPVLDKYIMEQFHGKTAHEHLLKAISETVDAANTRSLMSTFKSLGYLLKFVILSARNGESDVSAIKKKLQDLYATLRKFMGREDPSLIGAQALALKSLPVWLAAIEGIFNLQELTAIAADLINGVKHVSLENNSKRKVIAVEQLGAVYTIIQGHMFAEKSGRAVLFPLVQQQLQNHLCSGAADVLKNCADILSFMLDKLQTDWDDEPQLLSGLVSTLPNLITGALQMRNGGFELPLQQKLTACLFSLLYQAEPAMVVQGNAKSYKERQEYIEQLASMIVHMTLDCPFPKNWFAMIMWYYRVLSQTLLNIGEVFLAPKIGRWNDKDKGVASIFFKAALEFLGSPALDVQSFSTSKQNLLLESYGDLRVNVCRMCDDIVGKLDDEEFKVFSCLVPQILRVANVNQSAIRRLTIELYYRLMILEYKETQSFNSIHTETIEAFSGAVNPGEGFNKYFFPGLSKRLLSSSADVGACTEFLRELHEFCGHLLALRDKGSHEDDRVVATLRLMDYLRGQNRMGAFVRYVDSLAEQHEASDLPDRAAMILMLHANELKWDKDNELVEQVEYPSESEFCRKARIISRAMGLLDRGQQWEHAIELCEVLIQRFRFDLADYMRVAELLEKQAVYFRNACTKERLLPEYFRVGYYGKGYPPNFEGKEYIYCGKPLERLQDFVERIRERFPKAELMKSTDPPDSSIRGSSGQYLQIFAVQVETGETNGEEAETPEKQEKGSTAKCVLPGFQGVLPIPVKQYTDLRYAKRFVYKQPFSKSKAKKKENEFLDLWTRNYIYNVSEAFPTITARALITKTDIVEVTPIENAIDTIVTKNNELERLAVQFGQGNHTNISPFTMVLSGTIDACVAGGVEMYKKAFFTDSYLSENPGDKQQIADLKKHLESQMKALNECIGVHAQLCPPSMQQLQNHLETKLGELQDEWAGKKKAAPPTLAVHSAMSASSPNITRRSLNASKSNSAESLDMGGVAEAKAKEEGDAPKHANLNFVKASFVTRQRSSPTMLGTTRRSPMVGRRKPDDASPEGK
eukprot:TRINITY_DN8724_c0_g1_i1.p1 TRINITY_DN8724_c0_g1~~TRINITY_DN8724_c0_g1_i1.p1  ORF type:complete len:1774 (+),score=493.43 TRINITY_DN8724_c0_g1_i1:697-5322(+)